MNNTLKADDEITFSNELLKDVNDVIDYIDENYMMEFSIDDLLKISKLSKSYFFKIFKQITNMSPFRYKRFVQLRQAERLLIETDISVTEIAQKVGIEDQFYFSKIFKMKTGSSPFEFRQNNHK